MKISHIDLNQKYNKRKQVKKNDMVFSTKNQKLHILLQNSITSAPKYWKTSSFASITAMGERTEVPNM